MTTPERQLEEKLIEKLRSLKYEYREDIAACIATRKAGEGLSAYEN